MRLIDADEVKAGIAGLRHTVSQEMTLQSCRSYNRGISAAERLIDSAPAVDVHDTNVGKWIPCSERLPENSKDVLMQLRWEEIVVGYFSIHWSDSDRNFDDDDVIAWMPLPEPYKEEQE